MENLPEKNIMESIPPGILKILGPPPLLSTEDADDYFHTLAWFAKDIAPTDTTAWFLIKDLADARFEINRYRRFRAHIQQNAFDRRIAAKSTELQANFEVQSVALKVKHLADSKNVKVTVTDEQERDKRLQELAETLKAALATGEKQYRAALAELRSRRESESNFAAVVDDWIHDDAKVDKLLAVAQERFHVAWRELERHLRGFAPFLVERLGKIIEGEIVGREDFHPLRVSDAARAAARTRKRG